MTAEELAELEHQRRDADVRYNAALTALDHAVVAASRVSSPGPEDREHVATALMVFLQQITAFVETKDREVAATARARMDQLEQESRSLGELRIHVGVLQRAIEMLKRRDECATPPAATQGPGPAPSPSIPADDQYKYVGFEDQFRGTDVAIEERLRAYVPIFSGRNDVIDIGCGRGEFLAALKAAGVGARGVDSNVEMAAIARGRGLEATHGDALTLLSSLPDDSLGGAVAVQVVEHLEPAYLMQLIDTLSRKLRSQSPIVLETINPACWLAFFSSYIRDFTHVRPVHPETLQYLVRASGFSRVEIRYSAPVPDHVKMKTIDLPADILAMSDASATAMARIAHTVNTNAIILNNLLFSHLDYAVVGYRS